MPALSRFYGIVIFMNYNDHPPPHFHARYQGNLALLEIESGLVTGTMPRRALRLIFEWAEAHHEELIRGSWQENASRLSLLLLYPSKARISRCFCK